MSTKSLKDQKMQRDSDEYIKGNHQRFFVLLFPYNKCILIFIVNYCKVIKQLSYPNSVTWYNHEAKLYFSSMT